MSHFGPKGINKLEIRVTSYAVTCCNIAHKPVQSSVDTQIAKGGCTKENRSTENWFS